MIERILYRRMLLLPISVLCLGISLCGLAGSARAITVSYQNDMVMHGVFSPLAPGENLVPESWDDPSSPVGLETPYSFPAALAGAVNLSPPGSVMEVFPVARRPMDRFRTETEPGFASMIIGVYDFFSPPQGEGARIMDAGIQGDIPNPDGRPEVEPTLILLAGALLLWFTHERIRQDA